MVTVCHRAHMLHCSFWSCVHLAMACSVTIVIVSNQLMSFQVMLLSCSSRSRVSSGSLCAHCLVNIMFNPQECSFLSHVLFVQCTHCGCRLLALCWSFVLFVLAHIVTLSIKIYPLSTQSKSLGLCDGCTSCMFQRNMLRGSR